MHIPLLEIVWPCHFGWGRVLVGALLTILPAAATAQPAAETSQAIGTPVISTEEIPEGLAVNINGELFTRYLKKSGTHPVLWPVIGPTGQAMTRSHPVSERLPGERDDHLHHRSLWFTHQGLNNVDFWLEPGSSPTPLSEYGEQVHREFRNRESGRPVIVAVTDWVGLESRKKVCEDIRTLTFGADENSRWIDFDIQLIASEGPLEIRDTKEGTFGVRVAGTMKVTARQGGRIVNSRGQTDVDAWSLPAEWVDYHGPVAGETVGIAILSHPSNFRPAPRWHVRDYGLFAANPFGEREFTPVDGYQQGAMTVPAGDSLRFRYRVLLHRGDETQGRVQEVFDAYAAQQFAD